jgi:glutamyl-tRNA synthetase
MKLRFAPSPTGLLHVGNARVALANWLLARKAAAPSCCAWTTQTPSVPAPSTPRRLKRPALARPRLGRELPPVRPPGALRRRGGAPEGVGPALPLPGSEEELRFKREQRLRQGRPPIYDRAALKMTPEQLERARANGKEPYWRFKLSGTSIEWRTACSGGGR